MSDDLEAAVAAVQAHAAARRPKAAPTPDAAAAYALIARVEAKAAAAHRRATEVVEVRRFGID